MGSQRFVMPATAPGFLDCHRAHKSAPTMRPRAGRSSTSTRSPHVQAPERGYRAQSVPVGLRVAPTDATRHFHVAAPSQLRGAVLF